MSVSPSKPPMATWSAEVPDPFAAYHRPARQLRWAGWALGLCGFVMLGQGAVMAAWLLRPVPVVVMPAVGKQLPGVVTPRVPPEATPDHVERFVEHVIHLRYAWRAQTVRDSMVRYLELSHPRHAQEVTAWLNEPISKEMVRPQSPSGTRLETWQREGVMQALVPYSAAGAPVCAPGDTQGLWLCQCDMDMLAGSEPGDGPIELQHTRIRLLVMVVQVRADATNPWGLCLLDMNHKS